MKKALIMILLIALITLPLSACETSSPTTAEMPATSAQADVSTKTVYLPLSETYTYSSGETTTVTYVYDENGHLTAINRGNGPNGEALTCIVTCDTYGRVTQINHAGVSRDTQKFTYDDLWRIASLENKYVTTQYIYSADGNLERLNSSNGWYELYTYENGLLTETAIYNSKGERETSITFEYDSQGRVSRKQQSSPGCLPEEGHYTYSEDGLSYTLDFGGVTQVFTYDKNGNLVSKEHISSYISYVCVYTYRPIEIPEYLQWVPYQDNSSH